MAALEKFSPDVQNAIRSHALKHGLDPELVAAQAWTESAGNPHAQSPVGAQGLMQLMPGTAKDYGVTDPYDIDQSLEAGTSLDSKLIKDYGGDVDKALAAYHSGKGNVGRLGPEGRAYAPKIHSLMGGPQAGSPGPPGAAPPMDATLGGMTMHRGATGRPGGFTEPTPQPSRAGSLVKGLDGTWRIGDAPPPSVQFNPATRTMGNAPPPQRSGTLTSTGQIGTSIPKGGFGDVRMAESNVARGAPPPGSFGGAFAGGDPDIDKAWRAANATMDAGKPFTFAPDNSGPDFPPAHSPGSYDPSLLAGRPAVNPQHSAAPPTAGPPLAWGMEHGGPFHQGTSPPPGDDMAAHMSRGMDAVRARRDRLNAQDSGSDFPPPHSPGGYDPSLLHPDQPEIQGIPKSLIQPGSREAYYDYSPDPATMQAFEYHIGHHDPVGYFNDQQRQQAIAQLQGLLQPPAREHGNALETMGRAFAAGGAAAGVAPLSRSYDIMNYEHDRRDKEAAGQQEDQRHRTQDLMSLLNEDRQARMSDYQMNKPEDMVTVDGQQMPAKALGDYAQYQNMQRQNDPRMHDLALQKAQAEIDDLGAQAVQRKQLGDTAVARQQLAAFKQQEGERMVANSGLPPKEAAAVNNYMTQERLKYMSSGAEVPDTEILFRHGLMALGYDKMGQGTIGGAMRQIPAPQQPAGTYLPPRQQASNDISGTGPKYGDNP